MAPAPILKASTAPDAIKAAPTPLPPSKKPKAFPCPPLPDRIRTALTQHGQNANKELMPPESVQAEELRIVEREQMYKSAETCSDQRYGQDGPG